MTIRAGAKLDAPDWDMPDVVSAYGNGTNAVTATTFTDLPTNGVSAAITNPHPTASLIVLVTFGAWLQGNGTFVRACPRVSGSTTISAGIGVGGPLGWGEIPGTSASTPVSCSGSATYELPASSTAATFTLQAYRDNTSNSTAVNYPVIRIIPIRYNV